MTDRLQNILRFILVFGCYFCAGYFGLYFTAVDGFASVVWLPSGVSLAAVWIWGPRIWPAIFLSDISLNFIFSAPPLLAMTISIGNTLEPLISAFLLRRMKFDISRRSLADLRTYLTAVMLSPVVTAGIGTMALLLLHDVGEPLYVLGIWWLGDIIGAVTLGFAILVWQDVRWNVKISWANVLEAAALTVGTFSVMWMVLYRGGSVDVAPDNYFIFPFIVWCAVRFGHPGVTLQILVLLIVSTFAVYYDLGRFARGNLVYDLTYLQTYIFVSAALGSIVASLFREKEFAVQALKETNKNLDMRIKEETSRLKEAQQMARIGSWEWDVRANRLSWSDELYRILGLEPNSVEATYHNYMRYVHPDDRKYVENTFQDAIRQGRSFGGRRRLIRDDGTIRVVEGRGEVVRDDNGTPVKIYGTNQDITEFYQTERELRELSNELEMRVHERTKSLEEANRAKEDFLAVLSHELRTPLNVILGWTEALSTQTAQDKALKEGMESLRRNALTQKALIDDLLDTSRIIAGKLSMDRRPMDLIECIETNILNQQIAANKKNIKINFCYSGDESAWIEGDRARIDQVISNILSNAIKFSAVGEKIDVNVSTTRNKVRIHVRDYGIGIDPSFLPQVFDRFRQESRGTSRSYEGLGLGLAIARFLVERHDGTINVNSEGRGKGAEFVIEFPTTASRHSIIPQAKKTSPKFDFAGRTILLVDDAQDILDLLSHWLRSNSARVLTANSVKGALDILKKETPDVILCDIGIPGEDGYVFIRRLRTHSDIRIRNTPAAALTAYTDDSERTKILGSGFERHLIKPISSTQLLDTVAEMLEDSETRRQTLFSQGVAPSL